MVSLQVILRMGGVDTSIGLEDVLQFIINKIEQHDDEKKHTPTAEMPHQCTPEELKVWLDERLKKMDRQMDELQDSIDYMDDDKVADIARDEIANAVDDMRISI